MSRDLLTSLCLGVVRLAARLTPARKRDEWQAAWVAEFEAARGRYAGWRRWVILKRALVVVADAVRFRWEERHRSERPREKRAGGGMAGWLGDLGDDVRYGLRGFRRSPGFSAVAVATIAIGIGATATIFSVVDAILWRPPPYPDSDRVVAIWPGRSFSPAEVVRLESQVTSFSVMAAYVGDGRAYTRPDGADFLYGTLVSDRFFEVLGRPLFLGRGFRPGEDQAGANDVVVLSYAFWQREFGGDSGVVNTRIVLDHQPNTVIGVLPPDLDVLQRDASFVRPLTMTPGTPNFTGNWVNLIGRLAPGVTKEQAQEELRTVFASWREPFGYRPTFGNTLTIATVHEAVTASVRSGMLLLMGAVVLTLLVATSNLANLLLNRALTREQEIAVRGAIGAGPGRILRQLLTESTIITGIGGAIGVVCSVWGVRALVAVLPSSTPRLEYVSLDGRVIGFALGLVFVTGWLAGLIPGLQLRRPSLATLHSGTRGSSENTARRSLRSTLVTAELALSVVLLVGSGVLLRSLREMNGVDTGMEVDNLLTFGLSPATEINAAGPDGVNQYYDRLLAALEAMPGVRSADAIHVLPVSGGGWNSSINVEGRETPPDAPYVGVWWRPVTDGYLETAGMRLVAGRGLLATDRSSTPWVAVINEAMARQFWPDEDPVGRRFQYNMEGGEVWITVVGVVEDVTHLGLTAPTPPTVYRPFTQAAAALNRMNVVGRWIVVRTAADPGTMLEPIRRIVTATVPEAPILRLQPMTAVIRESLADPRALTVLLSLFAATALILGGVGLYGVVGYTVRQRTRELGIRVALGASGGEVFRMVMRQGFGYAAIGLPLGLAVAWLASSVIADRLYHVSPTDPATYALVAGTLCFIVGLATFVPAWSARHTDPMVPLRAE